MNDRGHLSSESLDLLLMSSLAPEAARNAQSHLDACGTCRAQWEEKVAARAHFEKQVFPRTLPKVEARLAQRSIWERLGLRWQALVPALGAAVVLLLVVWVRPEGAPYLGIKGRGAPKLDVVVSRGESRQFVAETGARLRPKDRVRFVYDAAGAKYLIIATKDGSGAIDVLVPYGGPESAPVKEGRQEVPGSIELDTSVGNELLLAVFSDAPVSADRVRQALAGVDAADRNAPPPEIPSATVLLRHFTKEGP